MIGNWIEKTLAPPGIHQPRRRTLYRIIGGIAEQVANDMRRSKREFFAGLASGLEEHGEAVGLYRLPFEGEETYRGKLIRSRFILEETGRWKGLEEFLSQYVPGRFAIIDAHYDTFRVGVGRVGVDFVGRNPAVVVHVEGLKRQEYENICQFLRWSLGADIEFLVLKRNPSYG